MEHVDSPLALYRELFVFVLFSDHTDTHEHLKRTRKRVRVRPELSRTLRQLHSAALDQIKGKLNVLEHALKRSTDGRPRGPSRSIHNNNAPQD